MNNNLDFKYGSQEGFDAIETKDMDTFYRVGGKDLYLGDQKLNNPKGIRDDAGVISINRTGAVGKNSIAIGEDEANPAYADGINSVAIGSNAIAYGVNSVAIGNNAVAGERDTEDYCFKYLSTGERVLFDELAEDNWTVSNATVVTQSIKERLSYGKAIYLGLTGTQFNGNCNAHSPLFTNVTKVKFYLKLFLYGIVGTSRPSQKVGVYLKDNDDNSIIWQDSLVRSNNSNGVMEKIINATVENLDPNKSYYLYVDSVNTDNWGNILYVYCYNQFHGGHAEGYKTSAIGTYSHAEGGFTEHSDFALGNLASGTASHAEGAGNVASGMYSHVEGGSNLAIGGSSHAEGWKTTASGNYSHSEGFQTLTSGSQSHAEGRMTTASAIGAHAEGGYSGDTLEKGTLASGKSAHAEGVGTVASGDYSHAEGLWTTSYGNANHTEGRFTYSCGGHAEGEKTTAYGSSSHSEGCKTRASGDNSHVEGYETTASAFNAHAEGKQTLASSTAAHAEGFDTAAAGVGSHAEGMFSVASKNATHAEGYMTTALQDNSHTEGYKTYASGDAAHAEGSCTTARGIFSHAEGYQTLASGDYSHAGGYESTTFGGYSFSHGYKAAAFYPYSIALGFSAVTSSQGEVAIGAASTLDNANIIPGTRDPERDAYSLLGGNRFLIGKYGVVSSNPIISGDQPRNVISTSGLAVTSTALQLLNLNRIENYSPAIWNSTTAIDQYNKQAYKYLNAIAYTFSIYCPKITVTSAFRNLAIVSTSYHPLAPYMTLREVHVSWTSTTANNGWSCSMGAATANQCRVMYNRTNCILGVQHTGNATVYDVKISGIMEEYPSSRE